MTTKQLYLTLPQFDATIEQREPIDLAIKGSFPAAVAGILYRTGPGNHRLKDTAKGDFKIDHWFDGFAHIYRFELIPTADGSCRVLYSSRRQTDGLVEKIRKTGKLEQITFGQKRDPCESIFQKMKTTFAPMLFRSQGDDDIPDHSNIAVTIAPNVPGFGNREKSKVVEGDKRPQVNNLVCFRDASGIKTIDPETLEPMGVTDQRSLHPDLTGPISCAHAHFDPVNGDVYNFNLAFGASATYRMFKTNRATGKTEVLATISKDVQPAYLHSFFLTDDFVILAIWPSYFAHGGVKMLWERNIIAAISPWDASKETKWLVIDRKHGRGLVAKFDSPAAFSFHSVNAWQEEHDGKIDVYCDVVEYQNLDIIHRFYYENLLSTGPGVAKYAAGANAMAAPRLARYRLRGIQSSSVASSSTQAARNAEVLFHIPGPAVGELPTINPDYATKKTRCMYSMCDRGKSSWVDCIAKTDLETKETTYWEHPHHTPGEPIFVPDPTGDSEDAGFLLNVILDGDKGTSYLLCLDARTMKEVGRAECDVAVGIGFHGRHLSAIATRY
jgi:torulene dioxygenase